jgi:hypothetical protein
MLTLSTRILQAQRKAEPVDTKMERRTVEFIQASAAGCREQPRKHAQPWTDVCPLAQCEQRAIAPSG